MKAVVVYESMYGNTHLIADAVATGLRTAGDATVVPVDRADAALLAGADLVVVGGPTHAHSLSRTATRKAAAEAVTKPGSDLSLDPDAAGAGLRDWFVVLDGTHLKAAAFDTRVAMAPAITGRASKGIAKRLRQHGATMVAAPESFLVTKQNHLVDAETDHARAWGERLAAAMVFASL